MFPFINTLRDARWVKLSSVFSALMFPFALGAQTSSSGMHGEMHGMEMITPDPLGVSMDRMGSGTTWVPEAAPIPSVYFAAPGGWDVTGHGFAYAQYNRQGGARGDSQFGSLNWGMLMASHELLGGRFQARTMISLDAAGVTSRGYPLLLQSGESYNGAPLHDRQHPHDLWMELGALYERPVTKSVGVSIYAAPSGEPALGPVAFMHRPSAMDNPLAPISHHWQDATHITFGVLTAGIFTHEIKIEASYFNSREPDQYRYNFDPIRLDSYSGRVTFDPTASWSFAAGYGYLRSPEALNPDESMHRFTASILHGATFGTEGQWATSLIYGANEHSSQPGWSHSVLAESEIIVDRSSTLFSRAEFAQKSAEELVLEETGCGSGCTSGSQSAAFSANDIFNVGELSLGYIRELASGHGGTIGLGAAGTLNLVPGALEPAYGSRTPLGAVVFLRLRPWRTASTAGGMKDM
jgi:hypothetical protein